MEKEIKEIRELAERNYELIKNNEDNINENFNRINQNSYALSILKDYKSEAKKWFIAFIVVFILLLIVSILHFVR